MAGWEKAHEMFVLVIILCVTTQTYAQVLTPPYFNLAEGRIITSSATCGVGVSEPELFCRLTGATGAREDSRKELIRGQLCDHCDVSVPDQSHPPENAIDGTERWWQSPPLSRGSEFNEVNMTIALGQEFHVAYVFIRMANSPRPGVWALERSTDFGKTWKPWQYFADTPSDCNTYFGVPASTVISADDSVLCTTRFSKVVPLENGEIVVSLVNGRPSAQNFSYAETLQTWTKATNIRLRLLRTKTLLGHLMAVARQDPSVTRRYFYSVKDISIGGRCVCNGHAETCDKILPGDELTLLCNCQHDTCGAQCDQCCPGFQQKSWKRVTEDDIFHCEPCECYAHSRECDYDPEINKKRLSIDIHGSYEGGGVCRNCRHNTVGINCERCMPGYFHVEGIPLNATDTCQTCQCDLHVSTGECEVDSGRCKCRLEYAGQNCDRCSLGHFGFPDCIPCECSFNGTENALCQAGGGQCPCKENYVGRACDMCAFGFYNFPDCSPCDCDRYGSVSRTCNAASGQCQCRDNFKGRDCSECVNGYFNFPRCEQCDCDPLGCQEGICEKFTGVCLCMPNFEGDRCNRCAPGFYDYPVCSECNCAVPGSLSPICEVNGQCRCGANYAGRTCDRCAAGYYRYPDCVPCNCDAYGSLGRSCDQAAGQCNCRGNFESLMCSKCREGFYNYPVCEECNCNPAGAKDVPGFPVGGCGAVANGLLCECKDRVMGHICDACKPGFWNLDINNQEGCEVCGCHIPGSIAGINVCSRYSGQCVCKVDVGGRTCNQCQDGTYSLTDGNPFGCIECGCDIGGSVSPRCDKQTGQCVCKPRVQGLRCDMPLQGHFFPSLHHYRYEIEDGHTPEGYRVRFGYDDRIFPGFTWRGYAILQDIQPEVLVDVDITKPFLYQLLYRYINRNDNLVRGEVTLSPDMSLTNEAQTGEVIFLPTKEPQYTGVGTTGAGSSFVLNPGRWTISIKAPDSVFLDHLILIPQAYYEATALQEIVSRPCIVPGDPGPCVHFAFPDTSAYPVAEGENGYFAMNQTRVRTQLFTDQVILDELDADAMGLLDDYQQSFFLDLVVPDPGMYVLYFDYFTPVRNQSGRISLDVASSSGRKRVNVILVDCQYSSGCRQVVKDKSGMVAVFNISTGYVTLTVDGGPNINVAIDAVVAVPVVDWSLQHVKPSIVCIKVNGICVASRYSSPAGSVRFDFESGFNEGKRAMDLPDNILDTSIGLVKLNLSMTSVDVVGNIRFPGQYVILIQYYLPNSAGFDIDTIFDVNGQQQKGRFHPTYCPAVSGCRGIVTFEHEGQNIISIPDRQFRIYFNSSGSEDIWLDYLLLIPASGYSSGDIRLQPVDKSGDFISSCVNEVFDLKEPASSFCRNAVFTLTTDYNNGAFSCDCNIDGSLSFTCEPFGGQCRCRDNVIGRDCSACKTSHYGFPRCHPCQCRHGLCHPLTGDCICPPRVTGKNCDSCLPETFGFDPNIGCEECNCVPQGVVGGNLNCEQFSGQCKCLDNIGGKRCDYCRPGFHLFPRCLECDCDRRGTTADICDQDLAHCFCKDNTAGQRCDICAQGTYNLDEKNPLGCTKCFCFGTTSRCDGSDLSWDREDSMRGWNITNSGGNQVLEAGETIAANGPDNASDVSNDAMYWVAPDAYLGNRITSYGGKLMYTILFTLPRDDPDQSQGLVKPDIILEGNNMTIVHIASEQPAPRTSLTVMVNLQEYEFKHAGSGDSVSREQFMMLLIGLRSIHIRASYFTVIDEVRLSNVHLDVASATSTGDRALSVEKCHCPPNYSGSSCQECAPNYYRSRNTPYLGICVPCNCNGHADACDPSTGYCLDCRDNTTGLYCESCIAGYYGDLATGVCSMCACPLPIESNNFAVTCHAVVDTVLSTVCECRPGYTGPNCGRCDVAFYGNPNEVGNRCFHCGCNGNIDLLDARSCDRLTGECLQCLYNTTGSDCGRCLDWWYGDALREKNCQPCNCDFCGSQECNNSDGACLCKENVIGIGCDRCAPYYYGFDTCHGCQSCGCQAASVTPQCHAVTGDCTCQPGVAGSKCDRCMAGYWNYGPGGCQQCHCLTAGAIDCDPANGRCRCLPGVTGPNCDQCVDRWILIPQQGCQECGNCVHRLLDDVDWLERNITTIRRQIQSVPIGVAAFKRLARVNDTIKFLTPQVEDLFAFSSNVTLTAQNQELNALNALANMIEIRANKAVADAELLVMDAEDGLVAAQDAQNMVEVAISDSTGAVEYIQGVLKRILSGIQVTNIKIFAAKANDILAEIKARDFQQQNESAISELELALTLLGRVQTIQTEAQSQFNQTNDVHDQIVDLDSRMRDLQNSSRVSQTDSQLALAIIAKLSGLNSLKLIITDVETMRDDTLDLLSMAKKLILDAQEALDASRGAFFDLEREASRLDQGMAALGEFVTKRKTETADVHDMVNRSIAHADNLASQAELLDRIYTDTRDASGGAVGAANAYKEIVTAISSAMDAAERAVNASMGALEMSAGVGDESAKSKETSIRLLTAAQGAFNTTQRDLADRLNNAVAFTDDVKMLNMETEDKINELANGLDSLPSGIAGDRANSAADKAMAAKMKSESAKDNIQTILLQLPGDRRKINMIPVDLQAANRDIDRSKTQIDNMRGILPDIKHLLGILSATSQKIGEIGATVVANFTLLKERIALARDESNRIRVAMKFYSNTTVQLRNPPGIDQTGSYTRVSMFINSEKLDGLLLYMGGDQRQQPNDYLALELISGQVIFKYNLGDGPARIVHPKIVTDGVWHEIIAERIGKTGYLTIRTSEEEDVKVNGTSQGTFTVLELNAISSKFYLGGAPAAVMLPSDILNINYEGVIEDLTFDKIPVGLWNFEYGENNLYGAKERDVFETIVSNGYRFNGNGYVIVSARRWRAGSKSRITLSFKTYAENGLLFFVNKAKDFLSLEIRDGKVLYQYDLGGGRLQLMSQDKFNDGNWHSVQANRVKKEGLLLVDKKEVGTGEAPGNLNELSITDDVAIGGYNDILLPIGDVTATAFEGCIADVQLGSTLHDLIDNKQAKGVIPGCPDREARVVSFLGDRYAFVKMPAESIGNKFEITMKMRTHKNDSLLVYTASADQEEAFSVGIVGGKIVVATKAAEMTQMKTSENTYNDGNWHYISIHKTGTKLMMNIDDKKMITKVDSQASLDTEQIIYFGNVPRDYAIGPGVAVTNTPFIGCIGDVTVNTRYLNFASVPPASRVGISLASCPIMAPGEEPVTVKPLPTLPPMTSMPGFTGDLPVRQCALPRQPQLSGGNETISGIRFGSHLDSRQEYTKAPSHFRIKTLFSLEFKTTSTTGLLMYVADRSQIDYISLHLEGGSVHYAFNCGSGAARLVSPKMYNDGKWHKVMFVRNQRQGSLSIDGEIVATGRSKGSTKSINVKAPYYVGGMSAEGRKLSKKNLGDGNQGFIGCIRNLALSGKSFSNPTNSFTEPCSDQVEEGTFFFEDGGYVQLNDHFKVGLDLSISLEIRPRTLSGVLMAVHSAGAPASGDFLSLFMLDGDLILNVDNGAGIITARYTPFVTDELCDGGWHKINAVKAKNVVTLMVDDVTVTPGVGSPGVSSSDTTEPLFIGGIPDGVRPRGIETDEKYVGCIRNLQLNKKLQYLTAGTPYGGIQIDSCPKT